MQGRQFRVRCNAELGGFELFWFWSFWSFVTNSQCASEYWCAKSPFRCFVGEKRQHECQRIVSRDSVMRGLLATAASGRRRCSNGTWWRRRWWRGQCQIAEENRCCVESKFKWLVSSLFQASAAPQTWIPWQELPAPKKQKKEKGEESSWETKSTPVHGQRLKKVLVWSNLKSHVFSFGKRQWQSFMFWPLNFAMLLIFAHICSLLEVLLIAGIHEVLSSWHVSRRGWFARAQSSNTLCLSFRPWS